MTISKFLLHGALLAVLGSTQASALTFTTENWEDFTNKDSTGIYLDMLKQALPGEKMDFVFAPWKRARTDFRNGKFDGLIAEDSGGADKCTMPRWPIDSNRFATFASAKVLPSWTGVSVLKGKRVIWVRGYEVDKFVPGLKAAFEVGTMEEGMKAILKGRADVLIDYDEDMKKAQVKLKISPQEYSIQKTDIVAGFLYVCFRKNPAGDALAARFDDGMAKMHKAGGLKAIYEKYKYGAVFESLRPKYDELASQKP